MTKPTRGTRFSEEPERSAEHAAPTRAISGTRSVPGRLRGPRHAPTHGLDDSPGLPERPVPLGQRFGLAAGELVAAAVAFGAFWLIWTTVARTVPAMQVLAWFGAVGGAALAATAVARALRRTYPILRTATVAGREGVGVRAWPGEFWLEVVIDSALALLCVGVLIADLASGGRWLPWSLALLVPAGWFGGLSVLALTGRRNAEAVWLVDDQVVHESLWGRERAALADCASLVAAGSTLLLTFTRVPVRTVCPRPWRPALPEPLVIRVDAHELGQRPFDLAGWLAPALPPGCVVRTSAESSTADG